MAGRRTTKTAEIEFVINAREPALGVGIRVRSDSERETYKFVNGGERSFKHAYCKLYIKPAHNVLPEVRHKLVPPPPPPPPPVKPTVVVALHTDSKLEKAIAANPNADAPYRAYAAWLAAQGDPRGELIRVQCDRASAPKDKKLAAAETKLLETHGDYFMPPLLANAVEQTKRGKTERCSFLWSSGYLKSVRLARETTARLRQLDFGPIVLELVEHPSATFLRSLVVDASGVRQYDYTPIVRAVGKQKHPTLEDLVIGENLPEEASLASTRIGDIGPLFSAPRLTRLVLNGGGAKVKKKITHAKLRELVISTTHSSAIDLDGVLTGFFPALERFELASTSLELSTEQLTHLRLDDLAPSLTSLVLRGVGGADALLEALGKSELSSRLTELVVEAIDLDDKVVNQHKAKFAHIPSLVLGHLGPRTSTPDPIREHEVMRSAPDPQSREAARKLAVASKWIALGFDQRRSWLWGEYEGRDHYYVFTALRGRERGCDCGSAKDPCKHVLALRLLAARLHSFDDRPVPEALVRNASRERPTYGRSDDDDWYPSD
jgi:uncharacterized protein (TIGR02996 family)